MRNFKTQNTQGIPNTRKESSYVFEKGPGLNDFSGPDKFFSAY